MSIDLIAWLSAQTLADATRENAVHPMEKMSDRRTRETALRMAALNYGSHCEQKEHGESLLARFLAL